MPKLSKSFINQIKDLSYPDKTFTDDEISHSYSRKQKILDFDLQNEWETRKNDFRFNI